MKVALIFSGQPRFVRGKAYESIKKHILDKYDCDVYCHCWIDDAPMTTSPWSTIGNYQCDGNEIAYIKNLYNPVGFEYEKPSQSNIVTELKKYGNAHNICSMYKSLQRSFQVFEKFRGDREYDVYIRARYDLDIQMFPNMLVLDEGKIYAENYWGPKRYLIPNNILIFTGYDVFKKIMNIYNHMATLESICHSIVDEDLITTFVQNEHIPTTLIDRTVFRIDIFRKHTTSQVTNYIII